MDTVVEMRRGIDAKLDGMRQAMDLKFASIERAVTDGKTTTLEQQKLTNGNVQEHGRWQTNHELHHAVDMAAEKGRRDGRASVLGDVHIGWKIAGGLLVVLLTGLQVALAVKDLA